MGQTGLFATDPTKWLAWSERSGKEEDWEDLPQASSGPVRPDVRALTDEELDSALHRMLQVAQDLVDRSRPKAGARRRAG